MSLDQPPAETVVVLVPPAPGLTSARRASILPPGALATLREALERAVADANPLWCPECAPAPCPHPECAGDEDAARRFGALLDLLPER